MKNIAKDLLLSLVNATTLLLLALAIVVYLILGRAEHIVQQTEQLTQDVKATIEHNKIVEQLNLLETKLERINKVLDSETKLAKPELMQLKTEMEMVRKSLAAHSEKKLETIVRALRAALNEWAGEMLQRSDKLLQGDKRQ